MAAHLVIVESPGKTKKINEILGSGYRVRASFGHVRDLPSRAPAASGGRGRTGGARGGGGEVPLGLDIAGGWKPTWEVLASKADVVAKLKAAAAGAETVYLATDLDREGEAIAWHLADLLGGRPDRFRRVSFSEITPAAVRAAFAEPRRLDVALVRAQLARRFLDRVVGWQLSPLLGRRVQYGLSAGRVQTAALNLLVERDEQIRTFVAAPFWTVEVSLTVEAGADPVVAQLVDDAVKVVRFEERAELDEALVLARSAPLRLEGVDRQAATQNPRAPFTTSTLQQAASSRLKLSVSDTMASAQRLYEAGHITYMRSDAVALAPEAKAAARAWLVAAFGESAVPAKPPTYEAKAGAQEAHEAIRPTDPARSPTALGNVEDVDRHLYDLVRQRMLASQMAPARFERVTWRLVSEAQGGLRFAARGRSVVDPGFHRVLPPESLADEPPAVPDVAVGRLWDPLRGGDAVVEAVESHTKPPPRFTEASLVAELERQGVGRPSTYAQTIKTLIDRGYALLDRRVFVVTPLGRLLVDRVARYFAGLCDVGFTAKVEADLDVIAAGGRDHLAFLDGFYAGFREELGRAAGAADFCRPARLQLPGLTCPKCRRARLLSFFRGAMTADCPGCRREVPSLGLEWAPKRASRKARRPESATAADAEQSAADQRMQSRCPACSGALGRWKVQGGGYLHLCQAWPRCSGVVFEAGRGEARGGGRGRGGRR